MITVFNKVLGIVLPAKLFMPLFFGSRVNQRMKGWFYLLLQEEDAVTLGLSTGQALVKLRDQLSSLLEQHQRAAHRRASAQVHIHICKYSFIISGL